MPITAPSINSSNYTSVINSTNAKKSAKVDCDVKKEKFKINVAPVKEYGLQIIEVNPPKLPDFAILDLPAANTSTLPTRTRGTICGTGVGQANENLSVECNFVLPLALNTCFLKFDILETVSLTATIKLATFEALKILGPFAEWVKLIVCYFVKIAKLIAEIIALIQWFMECVINTIAGIMSLLAWLITMPERILMQIVGCISTLLSKIADSFTSNFNLDVLC